MSARTSARISDMKSYHLILELLAWSLTCVNGQTYTATIISNPAGTPISGSTNTFDYPILSNVTLTCMVTSSDGPTPTVTSYQWNTGGCYANNRIEMNCFPTGQTTQSVTGNNLLAEDAGTITCTVTVGGIDYTSGPLTLRISGIIITRAVNIATDFVTGNQIADYSFTQSFTSDPSLAFFRCASGLGPGSDPNTILGGWYFNGIEIPIRQGCTGPIFEVRGANGRNYPGVINLYLCGTFTTTEEGVYECRMMNSSFMEQTMRVGVYFSGRTAPMIDPPSSSTVTVTIGDSVTLSCTSRGSPPDTFTWRKDSGLIVQSTSITTETHNSTSAVFRANLLLTSVSTSNSGTYTCTVTNPIGSDNKTITVAVVAACPDLNNPTNGMITCLLGADGDPTEGDACSYTCNTGYVLIGITWRTCGSDGMWNGSEPTCIGTCPMLTDPTNGMTTCSLGDDGVATDGDTCTTICNPGYEIQSGDATRTCGASDSMWSGTEIVCEQVGCAMLTAPTNGMVNCSLGADGVATDGDTCSYTCNTGYMLIGNAIRTCESDGMWSGTEPTCVGTCPVLTDPTSGIVTCSLGLDGVATAGDTCSYICDNGFVRLAGDAMRTCGSDRSWSGSTVVCGTAPTVTIVSNPAGTTVSGSTNTFDYPILSSVTLMCMAASDGSTFTVTNYLWNTTGCYTHPDHNSGYPTCFPTGQTTQSVTGNDLTSEDAGTITCIVTIGGVDYTSEPLTLRISGIAMTGALIGNQNIVTGNLLTNNSVIRDADNGLVARCVSGLGPTSSDDNTALGIWYFNGAPLTYRLCEQPVVNPIQSRIAGLRNFVGVINLWQCVSSLTPSAEGVYTCVILDSSMMNQTTRLGVYFSGRTAPMIDPPSSSTVTVAVGDSLTLSCTSHGSPPDTFTWRKDSGPIVQSTSITTVEHTSDTAVFRANYSINSITTSDSGTYTCTVTNPIGSDIETIIVDVVVPTPPTVTISPSGPIQGAMVGNRQMIYCMANTTTVLDINLVMFTWIRPGGDTITNDSRVTINPTTSIGNNYTSSIQFTYLMEGDEGTYTCNVTTFGKTGSASVVLESLNVPSPSVTVTAPNTQTVGQSLTLECSVTAVRGITSRVDIIWSRDGMVLNRTNNTSPTMMDSALIYTDTYTISQLSTDDEGREYECAVVINASPVVTATGSVMLDVIVPTPSVSVTTPNTQIVGLVAILECSVTAVRGITSRVDIIWSRDDVVLNRTNNTSPTMTDNSLIYTDTYTISLLTTTDDGREYECTVVINASPEVTATGSITLDVMVPTPIVTISPSGAIQGAMVGSPQMIQCTVNAVNGVESNLVMISWMGPGGDTITNDVRLTINPATSIGNHHTSSIQFTYLMEGDEGTYMCNVMILETSGSASTVLGELIVPTPSVTVTAPNTQIVGQSLTLECSVTTVRGITSRVDITWSRNGAELQITEGVNVHSTTDNSVVYTDTYTIMEVSADDDGRLYQCEVVINSTSPVTATGDVALNVMVPQPSVVISQSLDGSISGLNHTLICTATVVNGVSPSLVMISWTGGSSLPSSPRVAISDQSNVGLVYTKAVTFSPLLNGDGGQYTCSVSVTGFDEAITSDNVLVMVNAPTLTVIVAPTAISGDEGINGIALTCMPSVVEDVALPSYLFTWLKDGFHVDLSNNRIMVNNGATSSSYVIDASNTNATLDNGMYTCQATLNVAGEDNFTSFSNSATVGLRAVIPPFPPMLREVTTMPHSVNISWVVSIIVFDQENYTVQYGTDMTMLLSTSELVQGSSNRSTINGLFSVNITGLTPFTTYHYIIMATNSLGSTRTSVMNFTTDETAPSIAPIGFASTAMTLNSITFQWTPLADHQANGIVRRYNIACNESFVVNITGTAMMGVVTGLSPFTDYFCTIFAVTVTDGPVSDPFIVRTAEAAPSPPVINTVTNISSSIVRVTWTRPAVLNGVLISYTITYVINTDVRSITVDYNGKETQSYDIVGLSPYQLISVTITATTGGGTSDPSEEEFGRSSEAAPGVVQFTTSSVSNTGVNVMWSPPSQPNGIITAYQVIYAIYDNATSAMSELLSISRSTYSISNLKPGVPYQVLVVAFTSAGKGAENNFKTFFSQELSPSKVPADLNIVRLNLTSINVTWTPLPLIEARGFPRYRVTLMPLSTNNRNKRQTDSITMETNNSYVVFHDLVSTTAYSAVVGVRTESSDVFMDADPITVDVAECPTLTPEDDDCSITVVFIVLFVISVVINFITIAVIIYLVVRPRKSSYSPNMTSHVYDAVELRSRDDKTSSSSEAEYEVPSTGNMDTKPRIRKPDAVKLQANPAYQVTNYNKP